MQLNVNENMAFGRVCALSNMQHWPNLPNVLIMKKLSESIQFDLKHIYYQSESSSDRFQIFHFLAWSIQANTNFKNFKRHLIIAISA